MGIRLWCLVAGLAIFLSAVPGVRAQERTEERGIIDEVRAHVKHLEDERAVIVTEDGEESARAIDLADRIRRLREVIAGLEKWASGRQGDDRGLDLAFDGTPLKEALEFLAGEGGLNFAYPVHGLDPEDRVVAKMVGVTATDAALAILKAAGYVYDLGPGPTIIIRGKDHLDLIRKEAAALEMEVHILELLARQRVLERQIGRGVGPGEHLERKLELIGVLASKGDAKLLIRTEARGEVECQLARVETDSGPKIHPEIAALVEPLEVGDRVRFRCLRAEEGWILQWIRKVD